MKPVSNDAVEMGALLREAQHQIQQAEDIAAGYKARIIFTNENGECRTSIVSFRAARYARKVMGAPALPPEGLLQIVFSSRGITVSLRPTIEGYLAASEAVIAYNTGEIRRINRLIGKNKRRIREAGDKPTEGGAAV